MADYGKLYNIKIKETPITAAQMGAIRATPIEMFAAPKGDEVTEFMGGILIQDYGSVAFTESIDNLALRYTDGSGAKLSEDIEMTGFIDQTADKIIAVVPVKDVIMVKGAKIVLHNIGDGEFGGGGDSTYRFIATFRVHKTNL